MNLKMSTFQPVSLEDTFSQFPTSESDVNVENDADNGNFPTGIFKRQLDCTIGGHDWQTSGYCHASD